MKNLGALGSGQQCVIYTAKLIKQEEDTRIQHWWAIRTSEYKFSSEVLPDLLQVSDMLCSEEQQKSGCLKEQEASKHQEKKNSFSAAFSFIELKHLVVLTPKKEERNF